MAKLSVQESHCQALIHQRNLMPSSNITIAFQHTSDAMRVFTFSLG